MFLSEVIEGDHTRLTHNLEEVLEEALGILRYTPVLDSRTLYLRLLK